MMTPEEIDACTRRLQFLEKSEALPPETIRDLKIWWKEKLREFGREKVIPFPERR